MEGRKGWGAGQGDNKWEANDDWGAHNQPLVAGNRGDSSNSDCSGDGSCGGSNCGIGANSNSNIEDNSEAVMMTATMAVVKATVTVVGMTKMTAIAT